jgi:amino acid adenylation domain-containing protein
MTSSARYWINELKEVEKLSVLSEMKVLVNAGSFLEHTVKRDVPKIISAEINRLAKGTPTGTYICFLSVLHILLRQYETTETIITALPQFKDLSGLPEAAVLNPLFIKTSPYDSQTVREYLNNVRHKIIEAYRYRFCDRNEIRDNKLDSAFSEMLRGAYVNLSYSELHFTAENEPVNNLSIILQNHEDKQVLSFSFAAGFIPGFADCFVDGFLTLLALMFEDIDKPLNQVVSALQKAHAHRPAVTEHNLPSLTVLTLFKRLVQSQPEAMAVFWNGKKNSLTYASLDKLSDWFAAKLKNNYCLKKGEVVCLYTTTSPEFVVSCMAVIKAGGVVLMVEENQPLVRLEYMLQKCQARLLLANKEVQIKNIVTIPLVNILLANNENTSNVDYEICDLKPDDVVFITFTSGSTGDPKGVMLTHLNMINQFEWFAEYFSLSANDVMPQKSSVSFVDALTELYFPLTTSGAAVYLRPYESINKHSTDLVNWFVDIEATIILYVPSLFAYVSSVEDFSRIRSLKHLVLGGEDIKGEFNYPFSVYNLYGNSECSSISSIYNLNENISFYKIPIGKPIYNTCMTILDGQLSPLPLFMKGEIYIGGSGVGPGYINDPIYTNAKFIEDPTNPADMLYKTGDFGRMLPGGYIEYFGRKDNEIKIRGIRIDTGEVENKIRKAGVGISEIAILVMNDTDERYLAAISTITSAVIANTESSIKKQLLNFLPSYMVPQDWLFVDEMPFTASGKLDRTKASGMFKQKREQRNQPANSTEEQVKKIWEQVLKISDPSTTENFFKLGGQSLSMVYVLSRIKKDMSGDLTMEDFIISPTIRGVAEKLLKNTKVNSPDTDSKSDIIHLNRDNNQELTMIMLHPFSGFAYYYSLGSHIEPAVKLYGMNIPGLHCERLNVGLANKYTEVAEFYMGEIVKLQLPPKFIIAGYSASVPLVFEIVKLLESRNLFPFKVLLVDDYFKASGKKLSEEAIKNMLNSELQFAAANYLGIQKLDDFPGKEFNLHTFFSYYSEQKEKNRNITEEEFARYADVLKKMFQLQMSHKPSGHIISDTVYLFSEKYGADSGWDKFVQGAYQAVQLKGTHMDLFEGENAVANARILMSLVS